MSAASEAPAHPSYQDDANHKHQCLCQLDQGAGRVTGEARDALEHGPTPDHEDSEPGYEHRRDHRQAIAAGEQECAAAGVEAGAGRYAPVIAPNASHELDDAAQDDLHLTDYKGDGGIAMDTLFRKAMLALYFGEDNILYTT